MMDKLKAKKAALVEQEAHFVAEIKKVQAKIALVDEMIADESASSVTDETPVAEAPVEAPTNKVVTIRV